MMHGNGMGTGWEGMYTTSLLDFHANWRSRADELSDTLKICMFMGQYYLKHHRGHYYAKAQNLARQLREEYDRMFGAYDLLLMPTLPMKATPLPPPDAPLAPVLPACVRDAAEHRPLRRDGASGDVRSLRDERRGFRWG